MRKKIDLLLMVPSLRGGGAERVMITLINNLDRDQFNLSLLVVDMTGAVYRNEVPCDVELIDLACSRVRFAVPKIIKLVWKRRPDIVFSTLGHFNLALAVAKFLLPKRTKTVAREAAIVSYNFPKSSLRFVWGALYKLFYRAHDLVICQSNAMQKDLVEKFLFPIEKSVVIRNPLDIKTINRKKMEFYPWKDFSRGTEVRLVSAGRMSPEKGFDILIDALKILNNSDLKLTFLGDGPLRSELECKVKKEALEKFVDFVGFQVNPYPWLKNADLFVLSSLHEGFPNVVLEALACGTPVVATPAVGGTVEILDGLDECIIAKSINARALSDAISLWLKGNRRRISENVVDNYSLDKIVNSYAQAFFTVLVDRE